MTKQTVNMRRSGAVFMVIAITCGLAWAEGLRPQKNLVSNGSFEHVEDGVPVGWEWLPDRAQGTLTADETISHSGQRSVKITNETAREPHVYSRLRRSIPLEPGEAYTISCYVRSEDPGVAWIGGGDGWHIRKPLPATGGEWQRVAATFTATAAERSFELMILTESPTEGIWVDDVQVELGEVATEFDPLEPLQPGTSQLNLRPMGLQPNLLPNPSFEEVDGNRPRNWLWDQRNTDATLTVDSEVSRSGKNSVRITNGTPFGAHVYGILNLLSGVSVKPDTTYTISCYIKGSNIGTAWIGGATGWRVRALFPRKVDGGWQRVVRTFTTESDEITIPVMIVTESPTETLWVDDLQLVEGPEPMPYLGPDQDDKPLLEMEFAKPVPLLYRGTALLPAWNQTPFPRDRYTFAGRELWTDGLLYLPQSLRDVELTVRLMGPDGAELAAETRTGDLDAGAYSVAFGWGTGTAPGGKVTLGASLKGARNDTGQAVAVETRIEREVITAGNTEPVLKRVEALCDQLAARVDALRGQGTDPAYPLVTLTVLRNFVDYAREDLARGEQARAYDAALQMEEMANQALKRTYLPPVPRFVTPDEGRPITVKGPGLLATVRWPDGRLEKGRPVQFVGHGHFGSVRRDVEKFPGYGMNIIQIEFGPNSVLTGEDTVSTAAIDSFLQVADRAAEAGVSINLLLSPHYFPDWALAKWPELKDCTGGFFRYCVHAPEARAVLEKFLRIVIPRIKDHPALHSLCLSNEPLSIDSVNCHTLPGQWRDWLREQHGSIERLNERWGTDYAGFDAIPVPPANVTPQPITYDFMRFNTEVFADFHAWMAGIIRKMAPDIPLHAKIMIGAHFSRHVHGPWSIDPELFGRLSDINGNDSWKIYSARGDWAANWQSEIMGYDFQRSVADKPIFNSENHIIPDRNLDFVPPEYISNVYWQGSIHGQSATTTWVWERTFDPTSDFAGSIMHRPACTEALGQTALDLMRLSPEVTALQSLKPPVVILWSQASVVYGDEHLGALGRLFQGMNFSGVRLGFVTERQLKEYAESGETPLSLQGAKVVVVPRVTHTPDSALAGLKRFIESGGNVVQVGECFTRDEYDRERGASTIGELADLPLSSEAVHDWAQTRFRDWGISRDALLLSPADDRPAWGVEYVTAEVGGRRVVNIANYRSDPVKVRLVVNGQPRGGVDLISGAEMPAEFEAPVLRPMLIEAR